MRHARPRRSVLCLVPMPPPITGAALASERAVQFFKAECEALVIPYQRGTLASGSFSFNQALNIFCKGLSLFRTRLRRRESITAVYAVISSTYLGNLRDLFLIALLGRKLRSKLVIHFHGATFSDFLAGAPKLIQFLNRKLLGSARAAIVLSPRLRTSFEPAIPADRVYAVPNFADDEMFISTALLSSKYRGTGRVKFLFLSNLIRQKGYGLLLDAFLSLPYDVRKHAELHFAGLFGDDEDQNAFGRRVRSNDNVAYHGLVTGSSKVALFAQSHVFCLPTSYEAQPISILEAYASGCAVIASDYGVLADVFQEGVHGYRVNLEGHPEVNDKLLRRAIAACVENPAAIAQFGAHNRQDAESRYRVQRYGVEIRNIVLGE